MARFSASFSNRALFAHLLKVALIALVTAWLLKPVSVAEGAMGASPTRAGDVRVAECFGGIECLEKAAKQLGKPCDMMALMASRNLLGQNDGLTDQLSKLAVEQGLSAMVLEHIGPDQMARCPYPILLHVKGGRYSTTPDCFILQRASQGGDAVLFSPSLGELTAPFRRLAPDRIGQAIVLSSEPLKADAEFLVIHRPIQRYCTMGGVGLMVILFGIRKHRRPSAQVHPAVVGRLGAAALRGCVLVAMAVGVAFTARLLEGATLLPAAADDGSQALDFMLKKTAQYKPNVTKPPEITLQVALRRLASDAIFVDARDADEYNAGHIRNAICCPASDVGRWPMHMAGVDFHSQIVVYCAEGSCGKGEYVAKFLLDNGFSDVSLYRDGWVKWTGPKDSK